MNNIPVSRYSRSPLTAISSATLRRWAWDKECHPFSRYACCLELERRGYPIHDWPIEDPFLHFTTAELLISLPLHASDRITAHTIRDEIQRRGMVRRMSKDAIAVGDAGQGCYRHSFAPC